jgi:hypothetical protein
VTFSISYRQTVSKFQDQDVTLSMVGNATLGPLHEKSATLGESTQSPTTLFAGDIFTTGELPAKTKSTGNTSHFQVEGYQSDRMLLTVDDELTLPGLDNVADQDSVSELVVHQHADQVGLFAHTLHGVQSIVAVLRIDHALRLRQVERDKGIAHRCARRRARRLLRQKAQGDLDGDIDRRQRLLIAAAVTGSASLRVTESEM